MVKEEHKREEEKTPVSFKQMCLSSAGFEENIWIQNYKLKTKMLVFGTFRSVLTVIDYRECIHIPSA